MWPNNCKNCHANTRMHTNLAPFDPNNRAVATNAIATTPIGGRVYGASPIVWKVHKVHFGKYLSSLDKLRDMHRVDTPYTHFGEIVWPMDVRNCTKCHGMRDAWKNDPGYIACIACHDKVQMIVAGPGTPWDAGNNGGRFQICPRYS